jgi:hypothetical protein
MGARNDGECEGPVRKTSKDKRLFAIFARYLRLSIFKSKDSPLLQIRVSYPLHPNFLHITALGHIHNGNQQKVWSHG